jgi:hypothetical protein
MKFSHQELKDEAGLDHGTGAICCGCPKCHCLDCFLKNRGVFLKVRKC